MKEPYREILPFIIEQPMKQTCLVLYGAGACGQLALLRLKSLGIQVHYFCDQYKKGDYLGIPIINIEELHRIAQSEHTTVLICVTANFQDVVRSLQDEKIFPIYEIYDLLQGEAKCYRNLPLLRAYRFYRDNYLYQDCTNLFSVDLVVSERCTLRCRDCSNLMQYYKKPNDYDVEKLLEGFDIFLQNISFIGELRILGGEPIVYKELTRVLLHYKSNKKIMSIGIYTNATIMPATQTLQAIKESNALVYLSDYGTLSRKLSVWIELLEENSIPYIVNKMDEWQDCGQLKWRGYSREEVCAVYKSCDCKSIPTFLKGKLFACPYSAHAANLGAMTEAEIRSDMLSIQDCTNQSLREFLEVREYLNACNYCSGRQLQAEGIPPAIQSPVPLSYERRCGRGVLV